MKIMLLVLVILLALALAWLFAAPIPSVKAREGPRALTYSEAIRSFHAQLPGDLSGISAECHSVLLEHGHRTGRVILFFHGITNCPAQFLVLGELLYDTGVNVYIPRLPRHGMANRMTTELANLDAQELAEFAGHELDIAAGLGDTVVVCGLSLGAVLACYLAQERKEVSLAVPIAPLLGPAMAPAWAARPLTRAALALPNTFIWWDAKRKQDLLGPRRVYPRFATRAMAETMRLGAVVEDRAARAAPQARRIVMVTIGNDRAVNNQAIAAFVRSWQAHAPDRVFAYEFPPSLHLGHDVIDPDQPYQRIGVVYPILEKLLLEGAP